LAVAVALLLIAGLVAAAAPSPAFASQGGTHWILRTPNYKATTAGRTQHIRLILTESQVPNDEEPGYYRSIILTAIIHSHWRQGSSVFHEHELFPIPLSSGGENYFTRSSRRGVARLQANYPAWGLRMDLRFTSTQLLSSGCGGGDTVQAGTVSGWMRFDPPGNAIRPLTAPPHKATLLHRAPNCGSLPFPEWAYPRIDNRACLSDGYGVAARAPNSGDFEMVGFAESDGETATLRAETSRVGYHLLVATVPADRLAVAHDLSSITVRGEDGTAMRGAAQATADPSGYPPAGGPPPCQGDAAGTERANSPLQGNFTVNFGFGGTRSVADFSVASFAFHEFSSS
jgi:hypothetical protein